MVVEGTLARPDNHAEERPNRAAADPPRVNPALCTYEDAARHLRPVRGPHGEPASPLRCGSSESLEQSIRASTGRRTKGPTEQPGRHVRQCCARAWSFQAPGSRRYRAGRRSSPWGCSTRARRRRAGPCSHPRVQVGFFFFFFSGDQFAVTIVVRCAAQSLRFSSKKPRNRNVN